MVTSSIRRLSVCHGPSQSSVNVTSTPGQLAKHLITNASFRTKKISDDIPKVLTDGEINVSSTPSTASTLRMKSIVEENVSDETLTELTSPPSSAKPFKMLTNNNNSNGETLKQHTSNKEKLMSKFFRGKVGKGCWGRQWWWLVGRAVASDIRGPRFESSHRQTFKSNIVYC